jgi:cytochrome P450
MAQAQIELADVLADPFGAFKRARAEGWLAGMDVGVGVVRYEEMRELLADPRLHSSFLTFLESFGVSSGPFYEWMGRSPLNRDGADHLRWRALMSRTFTPRGVERLRPFLRRAAHALIDGFAARGRCDFVAEFADAYPSLGLCELIGVPTEDRDTFRAWANTIGLGFNPVEIAARIGEVDDALEQLLAYTGALAARRRVEPRDDLVTRIALAAREDGWTEEEAASFIGGLVFAGHETTKNQLGWMIAVLADRPDVWESVAGGALSAHDVVEEVLRFRSAVTGVGRRVAEAIECQGVRLEPGTQVFLSIWSADQDERVYRNPDAVDPVANRDTPHMAFGYGAHFCLGAALARAELQEALAALAARITCPVVGAGAMWRAPAGINGPDRLPITYAARAGA